MEYDSIIEKKKSRLAELESLMSQPDFYDDNRKAGELLREHRQIETLTKSWDEYQRVCGQISDNQELAKSTDAELAEICDKLGKSVRQVLA